jgi:hypothetical protein
MDFAQPINVLSMTGGSGGNVVYTFGNQIVRGIKDFINGIKTPSVTAATGTLTLQSSSSNVNVTAANSVNVTATNGVTISSTNTTGDINLTSGDNIRLDANATNGVVALSATGSSGDITLTANSINGLITTNAFTTRFLGDEIGIDNNFVYRLGGLQPNLTIYAIQGQLANPLGSWTAMTLNYSIGSTLTGGDTQFFSFPYRVYCCWVSVCFDSRAFNGFTNRNIDFRFQDTAGTNIAQSSLSGGLANADRVCICMFNGNSIAANTPLNPQFRWTGTGTLNDTKRFVCYFMFQQA